MLQLAGKLGSYKRFVTSFVCILCCGVNCHSEVILETASPGSTPFGAGATSLGSSQWMGARFSVDQVMQITSVGGHLRGATSNGQSNTLFGAIVQLSSPNEFPSDPSPNPLSGIDMQDVVGHVVFNLPTYQSANINLPLAATIEPGDYALIFGSGLFGATGLGSMPGNNPANYDQLSLLGWWELNTNLWRWSNMNVVVNDRTRRFLVEGFVVPEPATLSLLSMILLYQMSKRVFRKGLPASDSATKFDGKVASGSPQIFGQRANIW